MATYNGERHIREQLDSIISQTFVEFEVIICDDCSTDNTLSILREYEKKDKRIHVYKNEINIGFLKNFEKILSFCIGEYIACCDQDDIWNETHLETLLDNIGENDCVGANGLIINETGISQESTIKDKLFIEKIPCDSESIFKFECYHNLIQGTACLFNKRLLKSILPFPEGIKFHDHWIALSASIQNGCKYIPNIVLNYRNHNRNITGFKRFNLIHAIQTTLHAKKIRHQMYTSNIAMLKALREKVINNANIVYIDEAIFFFNNLSSDKKRLASSLHYIKNYPYITLCSRKKWKLFLYRLFCLAIFGLML